MRTLGTLGGVAALGACGGGSGSGAATPAVANAPVAAAAAPVADAAPAVTAPVASVAAPVVAAAPRTVTGSWTETATRDYFNGALQLNWAKQLGDFASVSLGTAAVADLDKVQTVRIPVTGTGVDYAITATGGSAEFASREASDPATRPVLIVNNGTRCAATRDTWLSSTTVAALGDRTTLGTLGTILVGFDGCAIRAGDTLAIELTSTAQQFGGTTTLMVRQPTVALALPASPVAADGTAADVVMRIEGDSFRTQALAGTFLADRNTILANGHLDAFVPTGSDIATAAIYSIPRGSRTARMFLRYTMTVAADWWTATAGKWPGITNTGQGDGRAAKAGWGGRHADGTQWSARLQRQVSAGDPFSAGFLNMQPYVYRFNRVTDNGDVTASAGVFAKARTIIVDEMVDLNSIGAGGTPNADGRVAIWVDGVCVSVFTGIVFRTNAGADSLPSEVWLDTYEGGTGVQAPHPMGVRYGPVIVSTKLLPFTGN